MAETTENTAIVAIKTDVSCGVFTHNLAEVKKSVQAAIKKYVGVQYTDANIKEAIEDKNRLSAMMRDAEEQRKALLAQYEAPYRAFKAAYDEVLGLVRSAYEGIKEQVDDYDARQAEAKRLEVEHLISSSFEAFAETETQERFLSACFVRNAKWWQNKTSDLKKVTQEIDEQNKRNLNTLKSIIQYAGNNQGILPQLLKVYIDTKDLAAVLMARDEIDRRNAEAKRLADEAAQEKERMEPVKQEAAAARIPEQAEPEPAPVEEPAGKVLYTVTIKITTAKKENIAALGAYLKTLADCEITTVVPPHREA